MIRIDSLRWLIFLITFVQLGSFAFPQDGGQAGSFLSLGYGARSLALGNSGVGLIDDASSIHLNPGMTGLVYDIQMNASLGYMQLDRTYYDLAVVYPMDWLGNIGVGWLQFGVDRIPGRDQDGFYTQDFSDLQNAFTFHYSRLFGESISLGMNLNYLYHSLAGFSSQGYSLDAGGVYLLGEKLSLAASLHNLSASVRWNTDSGLRETFPMQILLGASYLEPGGVSNLVVTADYDASGGGFRSGAEYVIRDILILRGGYSPSGYTFGAGILWGGFKLDMAYVPEKFSKIPKLHFTLNFYITPSEMAYEEEIPEEEAPEETPQESTPIEELVPESQKEDIKAQKSIVLITDGPLKFEKAEVIKVNVVNNTVTVRLLAVPGAAPITLRMDQVQFIK